VRLFSPPRFLTVETSQSGRYSGVDEDGLGGDLVSNSISGTKWGQAKASETPLVQEPILGWRIMGSHLVSVPFTVLANAPLDKKLNQSVASLRPESYSSPTVASDAKRDRRWGGI